MLTSRNKICKIDVNYIPSTNEIITLDDDVAWELITGINSCFTKPNHSLYSKEHADSMVEELPIKVRTWANPDNEKDFSTLSKIITITVNKFTKNLFTDFFNDIYEKIPNFIIDANAIGSYKYRAVVGFPDHLSGHAFGTAIDINYHTNGNKYYKKFDSNAESNPIDFRPYTKLEWSSLPETHSKYETIYQDSPLVNLAHYYTLSWGGMDWVNHTIYDGMHFSFIGDQKRSYLKQKWLTYDRF